MNYTASVSDYFKSPKWMMNTLLAGVCVFIPLVGPMVIKGWLLTGFWGRDDERPETFPDFDFNNFGKYLERGLWPFLVSLVSSLVITVPACMIIVPISMFMGFLTPNDHSSAGGCAAALIFILLMVFYVALVVGLMVLLTPLILRASIMQDFGPAFNFAFVKRFIALTWKEIILASVFQIVIGTVFAGVGAIMLCIGMYFAMVPVYFAWVHLHKQLYRLYLSRGGEPIPVSPKLRDDLVPAL
jgi:ABC-type glycerol-3-phosphate transport system permease component